MCLAYSNLDPIWASAVEPVGRMRGYGIAGGQLSIDFSGAPDAAQGRAHEDGERGPERNQGTVAEGERVRNRLKVQRDQLWQCRHNAQQGHWWVDLVFWWHSRRLISWFVPFTFWYHCETESILVNFLQAMATSYYSTRESVALEEMVKPNLTWCGSWLSTRAGNHLMIRANMLL